MRPLILETINFPTGEITQPLLRWAKDYDLPAKVIYNRYYNGLRGTDLLAPLAPDVISYEDIAELWGRNWAYNPKIKKNKKFKGNKRWVYVG